MMPKLITKMEIEVEIHFNFYKGEMTTEGHLSSSEYVEFDEIDVLLEKPSDDVIEELIWENREDWKED